MQINELYEADRAACVIIILPRSREFWQHVGEAPKLLSHMVASADAVRVPRFWSQEIAEHVFSVGFIRQTLDLHRFERERHRLLGLEDLDTTVSHGVCMML